MYLGLSSFLLLLFFFFNDTATTEIYTLSLHDALPISMTLATLAASWPVTTRRIAGVATALRSCATPAGKDRKSTRLNSSHLVISYAVFCLKKKKKIRMSIHLISKRPSCLTTDTYL